MEILSRKLIKERAVPFLCKLSREFGLWLFGWLSFVLCCWWFGLVGWLNSVRLLPFRRLQLLFILLGPHTSQTFLHWLGPVCRCSAILGAQHLLDWTVKILVVVVVVVRCSMGNWERRAHSTQTTEGQVEVLSRPLRTSRPNSTITAEEKHWGRLPPTVSKNNQEQSLAFDLTN